MKNIKSTPFLLVLILILICFASCGGPANNFPESKEVEVKLLNSDITTVALTSKDNPLTAGDTVYAAPDSYRKCLIIVTHKVSDNAKPFLKKVIVQ